MISQFYSHVDNMPISVKVLFWERYSTALGRLMCTGEINQTLNQNNWKFSIKKEIEIN